MPVLPLRLALPCLSLALLFTACAPDAEEGTQTGPGQVPATTGSDPKAEDPEEKDFETAQERAYRLLPILEPGQAPEGEERFLSAGPGLLEFEKGLGMRKRLILRRVGENRIPTPEDLKEIRENAGKALTEVCARNLREMLRQRIEQQAIIAVAGQENAAPTMLISKSPPFGMHSLLLLPEFWDFFERQLGGPAWAFAPTRQHLWILRRDREAALPEAAELGHKVYTQGAEPLFDRFVGRQGGRLIGGPRFAELLPEEEPEQKPDEKDPGK